MTDVILNWGNWLVHVIFGVLFTATFLFAFYILIRRSDLVSNKYDNDSAV